LIESTTTDTAPEQLASHREPANEPARDTHLKKRSLVRVLFPWIALALIGVYALQLVLHLRATSVTYDEPVTMLAGYHQWKCGDFSVNPENPPFVKFIAALPLRSQSLAGPTPLCAPQATSKYGEYIESMQFLIANGIDRIVIPTRMATSIFSILLAVLMLFAMRRMFGEGESLVALALLAFEPNMIAHGSLATMDMAPTAAYFASVFALYLFFENPEAARVLVLGLAMGFMLASKHSALPGVALLWVALAAMVWIESRRSSLNRGDVVQRCKIGFFGMFTATSIGFVCLWASYGFHFYAIPRVGQQTLPLTVLPPGTSGMPAMIASVAAFGRSIHILPEAYLFGIVDVLRQNILHNTYLFGRQYGHGFWYYFPIAFSIKTSLTLLILIGAAIFALVRIQEKRREMLFLLLPALLYFGFSLTSGLDIGVRHILPVYPLFICFAAAGACALARRNPKLWIAIVALLAFAGVDAARTFPNYISFSNELWGGTNNTYKYLSDSNVDWGQNLKQIQSYIAEHNIKTCWIAATGTPDIALATLPCHLLPAPYQWIEHPIDDIPTTINGTVFLSNEARPAEYPNVYDSIVKTTPSAVICGATFVYDGSFDVTDAALIVHSTNASFYYDHHLLPDAITEMRNLIALAPGDPRTQFALAMYLAADGEKDAARDEFNSVARLAPQGPEGDQLRGLVQQQLQNLK
jgi:4-amino-4-deoxy-L-arabinose transferase-like glycosyltransferase